jgi:ABC-type oligopeptide transport system ATPase subunit
VYGRQHNGHPTLENINFSLPVGRSVGLVGRIGSGKSTVAQLVPRLFDVSSGEVLLDGQDIRKFSLRELRRTLGYVPQDPFLFSTSLRRNLAFGRDEVSDEELARAVGIARLDRDLEIFPQGLNTIVGERGVTLSGGRNEGHTGACPCHGSTGSHSRRLSFQCRRANRSRNFAGAQRFSGEDLPHHFAPDLSSKETDEILVLDRERLSAGHSEAGQSQASAPTCISSNS